jgi:hypothetical protein
MSNRLELPPELQSLVEKREQADRRQTSGAPNEAPPEATATELDERRQGPRRADEQPVD